MPSRILTIAAVAILGLSINSSVLAAIYVYKAPNGSTIITDSRIKKSGYQLKKSYTTKAYQSRTKKSPYTARTIKSKYDALIVNTALKYDLEPSFIKAVIHVESAFDSYALSHAGAMGLMQLMPATASSYQLKQDHFNPNRNIEAGVQHMKDLMQRYSSDKSLSLAAYNAGQGAVSKYNGVPPFEETQNYIKKVMRLYTLYKKEI
jgi:soluble lytic murein transglycosylase-like protein